VLFKLLFEQINKCKVQTQVDSPLNLFWEFIQANMDQSKRNTNSINYGSLVFFLNMLFWVILEQINEYRVQLL
jgi:hypothetical protein